MSADTIFALATPPGRGAIAIIRISGPSSGEVLSALSNGRLPAPRHAARLRLIDPADGSPLDDGLGLWFPAPASATGEDVVELHLHGGRAVVAAVLDAIEALALARPAEPGAFSRRAFANGKLDLTQAEAIADLVDAETRAQHRQALRQLDGALGDLYGGWRRTLLETLALVEAYLDFPDEDLPPAADDVSRETCAGLAVTMRRHLADGRRGERLRDGYRIAVLGPPNAGKSSLLNQLAGRDVAIVAPSPGTTRDVLEVALDLGGFPVLLADTAGLRETEDAVEAEGVRRARDRAAQADLVLLLRDATQPGLAVPHLPDGVDLLRVANKIDLAGTSAAEPGEIGISARFGDGLAGLIDAIAARAADALTGDGHPALTRTRHRVALEAAAAALERSATAPSPELRAEDLRLATRELGRITGAVDVEDILDVIFGSFCIGK